MKFPSYSAEMNWEFFLARRCIPAIPEARVPISRGTYWSRAGDSFQGDSFGSRSTDDASPQNMKKPLQAFAIPSSKTNRPRSWN